MLLGRVHDGHAPGKGHATHPQLRGPCPRCVVSAPPLGVPASGPRLRPQFHCRKDPPSGRVSVHLGPPLKTIPFPLPGGPSESSAGVVVIPGHTVDPGRLKYECGFLSGVTDRTRAHSGGDRMGRDSCSASLRSVCQHNAGRPVCPPHATATSSVQFKSAPEGLVSERPGADGRGRGQSETRRSPRLGLAQR